MPWCGEDLVWLGSTLKLVGLVTLAIGAASALFSLGRLFWLRKAGRTDRAAPRGLIKWLILSIVAIQLCTVALSLMLSENSPLSRRNAWSRSNYAAVKAFKEGRPAEAESLGEVALELAEQLEEPGDRVCTSLANLREYVAAQGKMPSAWSYSRRLEELCDIEKYEPASPR